MERSNVRCPVCGRLNEGVDLEETDGWVECCACKTDFIPSEYVQKMMSNMVSIPEITFKVSSKYKKNESLS